MTGSRDLLTPAPSERGDRPPEPERAESVRRAYETALGVPFTDGNAVRPLRNGVEIFPAMLAAIAAARSSVRLLTFVYWSGEIAERFADALADRAREGVRVQVLVDAVGSQTMPQELVDRMVSAGVEFLRFRPLRKLPIGRITHRTHRKVLTCDGAVAFTGGVGIADEWQGDARTPEEWRETHFEVRGPAVRSLIGVFLDNWYEAGASMDEEWEACGPVERPGRVAAQVLRSNGLSAQTDIMTATELLVRLARERLRIQTAYFVPDARLRDDLIGAAERGVEVDVMLAGRHSDHRLCNWAGRTEFLALLEAGVRIRLYDHTMLHAKVATIDGLVSYVGSPNFNQRSMRRDDEVALTLIDPDLASTLEGHFEEDCRHARVLEATDWDARGPGVRVKEWLASLLRPHL